MDVRRAWDDVAQAIAAMQRPEGDVPGKLEAVRAGVERLFSFPALEILDQVERSALGMPPRALVSWLVFEGGRLPGVPSEAVRALRELYEATCPPGQGILPPPPGQGRRGHA
ncbi:MAG: hypothetical protein AB1578_15075 [Thermodesulfobacteriota bacterium]